MCDLVQIDAGLHYQHEQHWTTLRGMTSTAAIKVRFTHAIHYTPTVAPTNMWTTYTYQPSGDHHGATLPPAGTVVEVVASGKDFRLGTRPFVTIADAHTGQRYGSVPTTELFLYHHAQ